MFRAIRTGRIGGFLRLNSLGEPPRPTLRRGRVELDVLLVFEAVRAALERLYKSLSSLQRSR